MSEIFEVIIEGIVDSIKLIPFLFITYLVLEFIEAKANDKTIDLIKKSGKLGPLYGSVLGLIPLCGFSSAASNFFTGNIITLGTMIAVFLATSDEMIPIMIGSKMPIGMIGNILIRKFIFALIAGFIIDLLIVKKDNALKIDDMCKDVDCECEDGNIFKSALIHTIKIGIFVFLINVGLNLLIYFISEDAFKNILSFGSGYFGIVVSALFGLIPNCGISILLTQLFLEETISYGTFMAGILTNAGVGLAVLMRLNHDHKKVLKIVGLLLVLGIVGGAITNII